MEAVEQKPIVRASCLLEGGERLQMDAETAQLAIPASAQMPTGFHLQVDILSPEEIVVVAQKDVGTNGGGYHRDFIKRLNANSWRTRRPVPIRRDKLTGLYYTPWHERHSNRLDIYVLRQYGYFWLFQAGVVARGPADVTTFHLLTELVWQGRVFADADSRNGNLVAVPAEPLWGSFESRKEIFSFQDFYMSLRKRTHVVRRSVKFTDREPPLGVPVPGCARVDWWIPFAGQRGQGIAKLSTSTPVWVTGNNCEIPPDEDGVLRLRRGTDLTFEELRPGNKPGPPYLLGARLA